MNKLNATNHELSSKNNEKRLDSAIEKLKKGNPFQKSIDVFKKYLLDLKHNNIHNGKREYSKI